MTPHSRLRFVVFLIVGLALHGCGASHPPPTSTSSSSAPPAAAARDDAGVDSGATTESAAEALLRQTFGHGLDTQRLADRAHIAATEPTTAAGLFSRAYLASRANQDADKARLLEECVRLAPTFEPCVSWRISALDPSATDEDIHRYADPTVTGDHFAPTVVVAAYLALHDRAAAGHWLQTLEAQHPQSYVFEFLRGVDAQNRGTPRAAVEDFTRALLERQGYQDNEFGDAAGLIVSGAITAQPERRVEELASLLDRLGRVLPPTDVAAAWIVAGALIGERLNDQGTAVRFYRRSYEIHPSADAANRLSTRLLLTHEPDAASVLHEARTRFPHDPSLLADEGQLQFVQDGDTAASEASYRHALEESHDAPERRGIAIRFDYELLERIGRFRDGYDLIAAQPHAMEDALLGATLVDDRIREGDLPASSRLLEQFHDSLPATREIWFASQRERIASYQRDPVPITIPDVFSPSDLAGSGDGRFFSSGLWPARIYNATTGRAITNLRRAGERHFSPDGRYLAAASSFTERSGEITRAMLVYEVATGRLVRFFDMPGRPWSFSWSPNSTRIAWTDGYAELNEVNVATGDRRFVRASSVLEVGNLTYTADGRYLVYGTLEAHELRVFDAETLHFVRTVPGVDWVHGIAATNDRRSVVVIDNRRRLHAFDVQTWEDRTLEVDASATIVAPHPTEPVVLLSGGFRDHVTVVDVAHMTVVRTLPSVRDGSATFLGPHTILVERDTGMERIEYPSFRSRGIRPKHGTGGIAIAPADGRNVTVQFADHVALVDPRNGREVHHWPIAAPAQRRPEHPQLVSVFHNGLHLLDMRTGHETVHPLHADFVVQSISAGPTQVLIAGVATADPTGARQTSERGVLAVYTIDTGALVWRTEVPIATRSRAWDAMYRSTMHVAFDEATQNIAVATSWEDGFGHGVTYTRDVRVWRVGGVNPSHTISTALNVMGVRFVSQGAVRASSQQDYETHAVDTGRLMESGQQPFPLTGQRQLQIGSFRVEIVDPHGRVLEAREFESDVVDAVALDDQSVAVLEGTGHVTLIGAGASARPSANTTE